jgi:hypothetical protein
MSGKKQKSLDPLYQLFEHHLMTRSYEDSSVFTKEVAEKYLAYLDSTFAHIPVHVRATILEDLEVETQELLVKKMYGMVNPNDYQNFGKVLQADKNKSLKEVEFLPPFSSEESDQNKKS